MIRTLRTEIRRLLPDGSRIGAKGKVVACPIWPPDLFAVAATLVNLSQCYTWPKYIASWGRNYELRGDYPSEQARIGADWIRDGEVPAELPELWKQLLAYGDCQVGPEPPDKPWTSIVMRLMAIADEAANGIGYSSASPFARFLAAQHLVRLRQNDRLFLPNIPHSLCMMVPLREAGVQPKSNTPQVGCNLRSFSHNLALLPPERTVALSWLINFAKDGRSERKRTAPMSRARNGSSSSLNMLIVPFPYALKGTDFRGAHQTQDDSGRNFFAVDQAWLRHKGRAVTASAITSFISDLIGEAEGESAEVHAVVLPEAALDVARADQVAKLLAKKHPNLELFITGAMDLSKSSMRNFACSYRLHQGKVLNQYKQSKHHRWGLDKGQITRYNLGHVLHPSSKWWEQIDVDNRAVAVSVIREGASLAVLVCEDLARHDPVMPALQAVGPNLVIALLMDGPQFERRWPGRYATVLAEDPGSSVLTLTCLGMVERSALPGEPERREIALWKQRDSDAKELRLPARSHALLLSLTLSKEIQYTLDCRANSNWSRQFQLTAARGVRLRNPLAWLRLD